MRIIFIILLFCFGNKVFAQTKDETQEWIKSKIELFGSNQYNRYKIVFKDNKMWIENHMQKNDGTFFLKCIPIDKIGGVYFEKYESSVWLKIKCSGNDYCISSDLIEKGELTDQHNFLFETEIILNKSFSENDLNNRMIKAFSHLIKLYGGKELKEIF